MIILDTNVLSELMRRAPDLHVVGWLDQQPRTSVWTTSVTVLEVRFGLHFLPAAQRRSALLRVFEELLEKIHHRVLPFDLAAAQQASELMAFRQKKGRLVELRDTMIAGIALSHHAGIATRNTVHFSDISVPLINPWEP
jgi:toxin FitB